MGRLVRNGRFSEGLVGTFTVGEGVTRVGISADCHNKSSVCVRDIMS